MKRILLFAAILALAAAPAFAVLDTFTYADGSLNPTGAAGGWTRGNAGTSWVWVENQTVKVTCGDTGGRSAGNNAMVDGLTGVVYIDFQAKTGIAGGSTCWGVYVDDNADNVDGNLARFYGTATNCRGRISGSGIVTGQPGLLPGVWNDLSIIIDTTANTSEFFLNGSSMGVLSHAGYAGDVLRRINIVQISNTGDPGSTIYFDNLWVGNSPIPEPSGLLAMSVFGVGFAGWLRRRRA